MSNSNDFTNFLDQCLIHFQLLNKQFEQELKHLETTLSIITILYTKGYNSLRAKYQEANRLQQDLYDQITKVDAKAEQLGLQYKEKANQLAIKPKDLEQKTAVYNYVCIQLSIPFISSSATSDLLSLEPPSKYDTEAEILQELKHTIISHLTITKTTPSLLATRKALRQA
jgi:hypothetical protein